MVESKHSRVRPVVSPASTLRRSSSKSFQECRDIERISVLDLKALIVKRLGRQRSNRYFVHFVRFLSSDLSKIELDKLVIATVGKKNISLHNQLVRAIINNAIKGKAPPPLLPCISEHFENFSSKNQSPSVTSNRPHTSPSTVSNGDSLLSSPRSVRSTAFHNRDRDHRVSHLGYLEAHSAPNSSQLVQQPEVATKQLDVESHSFLKYPTNKVQVSRPVSDDIATVIESEVFGGEVIFSQKEEREELLSLGNSIRGSLGFPSRFDSGNSGRRSLLCAFQAHFLRQSGCEIDLFSSAEVPDDDTMHSLIEQAAIREGLEGVSRECTDILSCALDAYLKRLIKSCVTECPGPVDRYTFQDCSSRDKNVTAGSVKLRHGVKGHRIQPVLDLVKLQRGQSLISLMNFKAAMDLNPLQLGGNWAVLLEKILFRVFDQ